MPVADFGVKALGVGLMANDDTIKQNPDLVRRFVRASLKGWNEALKNPAEAAAIGKKYFPLADDQGAAGASRIAWPVAPFAKQRRTPDRLDGGGGLARHDRHAEILHGTEQRRADLRLLHQ